MSKTLKAIIVEDEPQGLKNLQNLLLKYCEDVEIVATAEDVASATTILQQYGQLIDVAFLDISLPDGLVFQVLNHLTEIPFEVVFVTAYDKFAIKACEYAAIGYVLKPIDPAELQNAVARVRAGRAEKFEKRVEVFQQHYPKINAFGKISISAVDGIYFVNIKEISYLEADDNYTHIFTKMGERMTVAKTIKYYEELLTPMNFFRVHKRFLINLNYLNRFMKSDGIVMMDDGKKIEVSRRRRPAFMDLLKNLEINLTN